jgi:hypothetical protein
MPDREREGAWVRGVVVGGFDLRVCMLTLLRTDRRGGGSRDCNDVGSMEKTVDETLVCSTCTSSMMGVQWRR